MTRAEEIKKIASAFAIDEVKDTCNPASKRGLLYAGFVSGAEWADAYPHWISVEDELPEDYEPILAVVGGNHFAFVGICINKKTWYCEIQNKAIEIIGITHWMPLPQPPKEGDKE